MKLPVFITVIVLLMGVAGISAPKSAFAHGIETHKTKQPMGGMSGSSPSEMPKHVRMAMKSIGKDYGITARPILETKCGLCHGKKSEFPWYYSIPGIKQMINGDITEGKKHLDISDGYPFGGHGTTEDDLQVIAKSIKDRDMPPLRFKVMHSKASLTEEEEAQVINWVDRSLNTLQPQWA